MTGRVLAIVLAGGAARRFGPGGKALAPLAGRALIAHVMDRVRPQVDALAFNTNADMAAFSVFSVPIVPDPLPPGAGPLAGVLAGLEHARDHHPEVRAVASVPCDTPFLPADLVARLREAKERSGRPIALAASGGRTHPACGLWSVALAAPLRAALIDEGARTVMAWAERYDPVIVSWPARSADPFFNINTRDDLERAEALIGASDMC